MMPVATANSAPTPQMAIENFPSRGMTHLESA